MELDVKKRAFVQLGRFLSQFTLQDFVSQDGVVQTPELFAEFAELIHSSVHYNGWFTEDQVRLSVKSWADALSEDNINSWTKQYNFNKKPNKKVGLILAGNIPLVGFHDLICVLLSGNTALIKLSSNDQKLLPFMVKYLCFVAPEFESRIQIITQKLEGFEAVIATGSDNTARYFDYYFSKVPHIIRKNRNSVAVLDGSETAQQMIDLGKDIFTYYGLGCRNVSKIFVPKDYNFDAFFNGMYPYNEVIQYERYAHNYDYNKAVFLMSDYKILDNGFLTIRQDQGYASPISSVFYSFYDSIEQVQQQLEQDKDKIQCIVSKQNITGSIGFGQTQYPQLWDYADNVDTMEFLLNL